ncbi:MAG: zinc-ribbon domain-containing protein, partial [Spirochaetaceae bacterium]|nr:zinc-ribbon domain-containing protein [Spirochaetaceae bacterium]
LTKADLMALNGITEEDAETLLEVINDNIEIIESEDEHYECPDCGAAITPEVKQCPNCGVALEFA